MRSASTAAARFSGGSFSKALIYELTFVVRLRVAFAVLRHPLQDEG